MTEKSWTKNKNDEHSFWLAGDGMIRREHNINTVKTLIKSGLSYNQIYKLARKCFRIKTFDEYYKIALDEINDSDTESATDYMKKKQAEKEKEAKK